MNQDTGVWIATVIMTLVLLWGLRIIAWALLRSPNPVPLKHDGETVRVPPSQPLAYTVLADRPDADTGEYKGSFSRTAGAFGAMSLVAGTIGISYWLVFDLFEHNGANLNALQNAGWYFLPGASLFAPYAFNQLAQIFNPK